MKYHFPLIFSFAILGCAPKSQAIALKNYNATLNLTRAANGFTLQLSASNALFEQSTPLAIEVVDKTGAANWIYGSYNNVSEKMARSIAVANCVWSMARASFFVTFTRAMARVLGCSAA